MWSEGQVHVLGLFLFSECIPPVNPSNRFFNFKPLKNNLSTVIDKRDASYSGVEERLL